MHLSWGASDYCVICCADRLLLSCNSCGETHNYFLDCPAPIQSQSINNESVNTNSEFLQNQLCKSPASAAVITPSCGVSAEQLVGCCISACERYVAAITSSKRVLLWRRSGLHDWLLWSNWQLVKRPIDLVFDSKACHLLVADKTGDVLQFAVTDPTSAMLLTTTQAVNTCEISSTTHSVVTSVTSVPETSSTVVSSVSGSVNSVSGRSSVPAVSTASPPILLGHLSMLLSLTVSRCGRYVVTGDRDEKVRVSEYPRAHNIASFCLGHTEFVGQLRTLPALPRCLLSGSGDGTLRVWYLEDGRAVSMIDTHPYSAPYCYGSCDDTSDCDKLSQPPSTSPDVSAASPSTPSPQCRNAASDTNTALDVTGRGRVVPRQCAVTCVAVSPPPLASTALARLPSAAGDCLNENTGQSNGKRGSTSSETARVVSQGDVCVESDLMAVLYDRARCVSVYSVTSRPSVALHHLSTSSLPTTPSTVLWLDRDTLAVVCALDKEQHENANIECDAPSSCAAPVLVYRWSGSALEPLPQHALAVFAAQHAPAFCGAPRLDAKVLYKQRYDNEAEYQRKKQSRIQQHAQRQTKDAVCCKRVRLEETVPNT